VVRPFKPLKPSPLDAVPDPKFAMITYRCVYCRRPVNMLAMDADRSRIWLVAPDSCSHITTASGKAASAWAGCNTDDRVLVTL
jgi:hypothetical protein